MLLADMDIIFMVPKVGSQSQKQIPIPSNTDWYAVQDHLVQAMGYDVDEEDDVSVSYCFGNEPKSTCNSLEDDDNYEGIIQTTKAHCTNSAPLQVIIYDNDVCGCKILHDGNSDFFYRVNPQKNREQ